MWRGGGGTISTGRPSVTWGVWSVSSEMVQHCFSLHRLQEERRGEGVGGGGGRGGEGRGGEGRGGEERREMQTAHVS